MLLAGCVTTTSSTMSPATAKLECLECDRPVAIGMPFRIVSSWVGSCTKEGYTSFFHENKETHQIEWQRDGFTSTKACDDHHYKIAVKCSAGCVIRAVDSPDTSTVKMLGVYPETPGRFRFAVEIRDPGTSDVVAKYESSELVVRAPDEISPFEKIREIDPASHLAAFDGFEYFLTPGTKSTTDLPTRGTKYTGEVPPNNQPLPTVDRLQRACKTRTPGAMQWRPCTQGIADGDDVRIDVQAWVGRERLVYDVTLQEKEGETSVAWTCYRSTFAVPGAQICMRYGVKAGTHTLDWDAAGDKITETLLVGGGS